MKCGVQIVCYIITPWAAYPALFLTTALYSANKIMELQMQMMSSVTPTWLTVQMKLSYITLKKFRALLQYNKTVAFYSIQ